ncbi:MAG: glycine cleavage system protein GcvH [Blastocatellia bacterium]|nr:glycine cleavage system protein GcvH [Blastocatellia bacterium]MCS7156535.1 glycine cleavage system protein GcvH [Blastocatellia bacterium]MCX7751724.1 glycine cleavage system protein GcvH [Blastocatellia bacterium]MDW8168825.1 glycine cleavage system protein GcvH [Acidobacteriota bacterium]MDW8257461.1 glycine cleavage system protein GcvH [Acidobacteriota bacterium]
MATYPEDCLYTREHEWIRVEDDVGVIGITDYAQEALGDIVYVELPSVGDHFSQGEPFGNVESVKAVSELYMPVSGEVVEVNADLTESPQLVNEDPYGDGWMVKIALSDPTELETLMSASEYEEYVKEEKKK